MPSGDGAGRAGAADGASQVGESVNGFGVLGGTAADFGQGPLVSTSNPLDLALSGPGFFEIQTAQGIRYTRDGSFLKSPNGTLTTQAGEPVLSLRGLPIALPTGTISVGPDGSISVTNDAGSGVVAQLEIVNFPDPSALTEEGANRFKGPDGVTPVASRALVQQGAVESSNQDAVHGTMELVLIQRQAEMMQKALGVFDGQFDRTAVEQLGKV
jgi:flagellar basal-body rod protein FlgF/flagellar basal-body rod protein FlgG